MSSPIRVRFAPSPTGFFHIGSARTALFNWLYARKTGGTFVLRIEDTDKERNRPEFLQVILDSLRWLGMDWDEGPEKGGNFGPYFQSERGALYQSYRQRLLDSGRAYEKDGAVWFKLLGERHTEFDPHLKREVEKVKSEPMIINDLVRGRVERAEERDFVIFRSDGEPVFHLVNVIDDIEMGITHVIRGEDHLSNTPKHVELFKALGVPLPIYAHIPLILKSDGPGKMSKRDKGALIEEYQRRHFLPAAVVNYLCMLGWTPKDGREVLPISDIINQFELTDVHQGNARFDERKMMHVNAEHLKQKTISDYAWLARPILTAAGVVSENENEDRLQKILGVCRDKISSLDDLAGFTRFCFREDYAIDEKTREGLAKKGDPKARVSEILPDLQAIEANNWNTDALNAAFEARAAALGKKKTDFFQPVRFAVSGQGSGPDFFPLLAAMGRECVLGRLGRFIAV